MAAGTRIGGAYPVVPDRLDLRDRPYMPRVDRPPLPFIDPRKLRKTGNLLPFQIRNQEQTSACTGFALAAVIEHLYYRAKREANENVSPWMIYSMARRYDEFRGSGDEGSSLRGALKGWYKHGVCADRLWRTRLKMPKPNNNPKQDWWLDAAKRPLGAYYRVDTRSVTDMQVALNDVGVLYASAVCHKGWDVPKEANDRRLGHRIPFFQAEPDDGGHAFAIVGYDAFGFWILNSWGMRWGKNGLALLSYEDWLENAMDCWVAQLGVVTSLHMEIAKASTLRAEPEKGGVRVSLANDRVLRNREISPFVVNMANNGALSSSGEFRTNLDDLKALVSHHLGEFRKVHGIATGQPVDIAIYAHGGLTSEETAASTAARWIPKLYENKVFPIFFMWETDLWSTLRNRCQDVVTSFREGAARPTGGIREYMRRLWNQRLERTLAPVGRWIWNEMKDNADKISGARRAGMPKEDVPGGLLLYESFAAEKVKPEQVRLHLVGHSAGAIVHSFLADRLAKAGWGFQSITFMAPAVNLDTFSRTIAPHLGKKVQRYVQLHLTEQAEEDDPTCKPILYYQRSLLHLVANSFEPDRPTRILGLQRDFERWKTTLPQGKQNFMQSFASPGDQAQATTHGGFDDDDRCLQTVLKVIAGTLPMAPAAPVAVARRARRRRAS